MPMSTNSTVYPPDKTHSLIIGYLLWIFGFTGADRFDYGKPITGTIWFFTGGSVFDRLADRSFLDSGHGSPCRHALSGWAIRLHGRLVIAHVSGLPRLSCFRWNWNFWVLGLA